MRGIYIKDRECYRGNWELLANFNKEKLNIYSLTINTYGADYFKIDSASNKYSEYGLWVNTKKMEKKEGTTDCSYFWKLVEVYGHLEKLKEKQ